MKVVKTSMLFAGIYLLCTGTYAQKGLWSSESELKKNPVSGPAWEAVKTAADIDFSKPVINNNNSNDDVNCLAASIVFARTGEQSYRNRVVEALEYNISKGNPGFDSNGILTWCRNTGAYALSADLIDYRTPEFEMWLKNMVETYRDPANHNNTIEEIFYRRANNWGTQAFGTLCAVYGYLKDTSKLKKIRSYWVQMVEGPNPGAIY